MASVRLPWRLLANSAGGVLGIAGVAFLAIQLRHYGQALDIQGLRRDDWLTFGGLVAVGVVMNGCLGLAWRSVLWSGEVYVGRTWAMSTYAITHIARYVPGNIFHYAGRQAVGMAAGLPPRALARASVMELAMVGISGALLGLYALPLLWPALDGMRWKLAVTGLILILLSAFARWGGRALARAMGLYFIYLCLSGATFLLFVEVHGRADATGRIDVVAMAGAYVVAWLIGMLTPGAPAGLGIREAVVLFFLRSSMDATLLLFAVLATRIVAVCADAAACVIGLLLRVRGNGEIK